MEKALTLATREHMHLVLHGESGTGKSWLYKKVFKENKIDYTSIDCANVARMQGFDKVFESKLAENNIYQADKIKEEKHAKGKLAIAEGGLATTREREMYTLDPFLRLVMISNKNLTKPHFFVVENFERISDEPKYLAELANLITLLDNDSYASFNIRFLIVGTIAEVRQMYASIPQLAPVANRLKELPRLRPLNKTEVQSFCNSGYELVGFPLTESSNQKVGGYIFHATFGIPQRLHEFCLQHIRILLSNEGSTVDVENPDYLISAGYSWLNESLIHFVGCIESVVGHKITYRRRLVLYACMNLAGLAGTGTFRVNEVETEVEQKFGRASNGSKLRVSSYMADLVREGVLTKFRNRYVFADLRFVMVARIYMKRTDTTVILRHRPERALAMSD